MHSFRLEIASNGKLGITKKFGLVMKLKDLVIAIPTPRLSSLNIIYNHETTFMNLNS